ncbi:MAG: MFS transporter [Candidatus Aenigmarchaeota archaeon]|nr:MFS transporter [Candidatus Aenigmarchaeota archaeon]
MSDYKSNIWKMYLLRFFRSFHMVSGVLIPFFTDWGNLNFTQVLFLQSWFLIWVFLLEIPTGTVADYLGRKTSLFFAGLVGTVGAIIYSSSPNFYVFMIGEFLFAMSVALMSGADQALIYDSLKKTKQTKISKEIFARYESLGVLGIMIAAPIGSYIGVNFGLQAPMLLMSIPMLLSVIISLTLKEPSSKARIESKRYLNILKEGTRYFFKHKILKILALDMVIIGVVSYFIIWLYQPLIRNIGISIIYFGLIHAAVCFVEILIMNNFRKLENILGSKKRLIFLSAFIPGIMFIVAGLTTFLPLLLLSILLIGGFGLTRRILFASYFNKYIPSDKRATVLSTISMFRTFAIAIVNPFVGMLTDWSLYYTAILLGAIAVLFAFISRTKEKMLKE